MPALETCKIVDPKQSDDYLIINADAFLPHVHTLWNASAPQAAPSEDSPSAAALPPAPPVAATPRLQLASRKKPPAKVKRSVK